MFCFVFFVKQKTAYELRISDWSSDVCSSDLFIDSLEPVAVRLADALILLALGQRDHLVVIAPGFVDQLLLLLLGLVDLVEGFLHRLGRIDRKSVVSGKSVSVRVDLGSRSIIKKKTNKTRYYQSETTLT